MKFILSSIFLFVVLGLSAQQDNIIKQIPSEVKGIKFDTIQVSKFIKSGDSYVVYGLLRREGAILEQKTIGKTMGKEPIRLRAFAKLEYDKDFNLKNETLHFLCPSAYEGKTISLLEGPSGLLKIPEIIAHPDDIVTFRELQKKYPEVYQQTEEETVEEKVARSMYYDNRILKGGGSRIKGITIAKNTPKQKERKGLFADVARTWDEAIPYDTEYEKVEFDYVEQTKKDYWKANSSITAPKTGLLYSHHSRVIGSDKAKKNNEYLQQEIATFDMEGKVLNRIEMTFERPMDLAATRSIKNEKGELEYALFLVSEKKRIAKKMGLEPNPNNASIYILDKDGKQISAVDFEMGSARVPIQKIIPMDGKFLTIGTGFGSFESYLFGSNKLEASYIFKKGSEEYDRIAPSYRVKILETLKEGTNTNMLGIYTEKKEITSPDPMRPDAGKRKYGNYFLLQYDEEGKLVNYNHIPRPKTVSEIIVPSVEIIKQDDASMTILAMHGIQKKDTPWEGLHPTVAVVNKGTFDIKTQSLPINYKLSSDQAFFTEEGRVILLVQNDENKYAFAELKF